MNPNRRASGLRSASDVMRCIEYAVAQGFGAEYKALLKTRRKIDAFDPNSPARARGILIAWGHGHAVGA